METKIDVESGRCIYRVPVRIRRGKEKECTPSVVSIGPLHHGRKSLKVMEEQKEIYLQDFLQRTNLSREWCFNVVKEHEERLRGCYDERTEDYFSSDKFVNIILVDAVFIIEVLLRGCFEDKFPAPPLNDRIFGRSWMIQEVRPDMMLLGNQVPFFILGALFDPNKSKLLPEDDQSDCLIMLAYNFFRYRVHLDVKPDKLEKMLWMNVEHFVHFLLCLHTPLDAPRGVQLSSGNVDPPTLTELRRAGVNFEVGSNIDVLDAQFTSGTLKLPRFIVDRRTVKMIRNMLAFEQCHLESRYLSEYVRFFNCLVSTSKDVDLLVDHGIAALIPPDSSEVISLKTGLSNGIMISAGDLHFATVCESLNSYVKIPWNKWKANLKQNYFNTPWATISVVAAAFLIILTLLQTVFSSISTYK